MTEAAMGAVCGLGLLCVAVGVRGAAPPPARPRPSTAGRAGHRLALDLAVFVLVGTAAFLLTGWTVGAVLAAVAAVAVPRSLGDAAEPRGAVGQAEAVAAWAEMLRDTIAAAAGVEEAIISTAPVAPLAVRTEAQRLANRLRHQRLAPALREFAAELDDSAADLVVAALLLASEHHARDLGPLLGALATSARAEAAMVLRVEAGRSRLRTAARVVTVTTLGFAVLLVAFNRDFLEPYDDALGQAWLLVVGGFFALGIRELGRMSRIAAPPRLLAAAPAAGSAS